MVERSSISARVTDLDSRTRDGLMYEIQKNLYEPQSPVIPAPPISTNITTTTNNKDDMLSRANSKEELDLLFRDIQQSLEASKHQFAKLVRVEELVSTRESYYRKQLQERADLIQVYITRLHKHEEEWDDLDEESDEESDDENKDGNVNDKIDDVESALKSQPAIELPSEETIQAMQKQYDRDMTLLAKVSENLKSITQNRLQLREKIDVMTRKLEDILEKQSELDEFIEVAQKAQDEEQDQLTKALLSNDNNDDDDDGTDSGVELRIV